MTKMKRFEYLFFDVDDTLVDFYKSLCFSLEKCFDKWNLQSQFNPEVCEIYWKINESKWKLLELGKITKDRLAVERFEDFLEVMHITSVNAEEMNRYYMEHLGQVCYPYQGVIQLLLDLKEEHRLFLVTNGTASIQRNKLRLSGIDQLVEDIFISEEMHHNKPSKEFFEEAFSRIEGFQKEKAIIIGDSLTSDMQGGRNAGITTCFYNRKNETDDKNLCDYTINQLDSIRKIV